MRLSHALFASVILGGIALVPGESRAQSTSGYPTVTFDAVTSFTTGLFGSNNAFFVTGVQHGAGGPSNLIFTGNATASPNAAIWEACEKQLLTAINRPGRLSFGVTYATGPTPPTTGTATTANYIYSCTLTQLP